MSDHFAFLQYMKEDERTILLQVPDFEKKLASVVISSSLLWGCLMKWIIYQQIKKEKISERPINLLILIDQVIQHVLNLFFGLSTLAILLGDQTTGDFFSSKLGREINARSFCSVYSHVASFMISYSSFGSMGIAIYRILYVMASGWINTIGKDPLMYLVMFFSFGATLSITIANGWGYATGRSSFNGCIGHTHKFEELLAQYNGLEAESITFQMKMFTLTLILSQIVELTCYIVLFSYLQEHDNKMLENSIITDTMHHKRKQINIFSMTGQICSFTVEVIYLTSLSVVRLVGRQYFSPNSMELMNAIRVTEFGVVSTIQVLTSSSLRKIFLSYFKKRKD